jgi:hypothetical protein
MMIAYMHTVYFEQVHLHFCFSSVLLPFSVFGEFHYAAIILDPPPL